MSTLQAIPAGGSTLVDPQRTTAVHAIVCLIEERLENVGGFVDDFLAGDHRMAIADARGQLVELGRNIDALEQLGRPMSTRDYYAYADELGGPC